MKFLVTPKMGTPINGTSCGTQTCNYTCYLCNRCDTRCSTRCDNLVIGPVEPCLLV